MALGAQDGRDLVAGYLAGFAPLATVYAAPPEHMTVPCVVLAPGRPYRRSTAFCADELVLRLVVSVSRQSGSGGLDELDRHIDALQVALRGKARVSLGDVSNVGLTQYSGGAEHLTAIVDCQVDLTP